MNKIKDKWENICKYLRDRVYVLNIQKKIPYNNEV